MVHIFNDIENTILATAELFVREGQRAIKEKGSFSVALSGGTSPGKLYEALANEPFRSRVSWKDVLFFFGDERYVPKDHPQSNYLMAYNTLFRHLDIAESSVFAIDTSLTPAAAASAYEAMISSKLGAPAVFDFILLGLGDNSHTASLFPYSEVLMEETRNVREAYVEEVKQYRITLTAPLINRARCVVFLVYGQGKAQAVHNVLRGERNIEQYPAQLVSPRGELHWLIDVSAAALIV